MSKTSLTPLGEKLAKKAIIAQIKGCIDSIQGGYEEWTPEFKAVEEFRERHNNSNKWKNRALEMQKAIQNMSSDCETNNNGECVPTSEAWDALEESAIWYRFCL